MSLVILFMIPDPPPPAPLGTAAVHTTYIFCSTCPLLDST